MTLDQYIANINQRYKLGNTTEHTFRGDLQQLIESLVPTIRATNEPKRQSCGAPDYILTKKDIPVGFIEAKDIGDKDLEGAKRTGNKEQFDRYKASLGNLIFTDYINFLLYRDGQFITKIAIARLEFPSIGGVSEGRGGKFPPIGGVSEGRGGRIVPLPENFASFENLIKDFCTHIGQTIKSSKKLAEMMAGKARLLSEVIEKALTSDETHNEDSTLKDQMNAFKQILIHDITPKGFADVYSQTIAYGMFAARLHDPTLDSFSRQEAAELIPKSNPFLRKLFGYIAGPDIDDRIKWIVDSLTDIFLACNVEEILKNYGKSTKMEDPIIHFYETFLSEYDPKLRKARGVWYTPAPVVNFIVRAVDDILKTEFDLPQGLADNSKTKISIPSYGHPSKGREVEVHKVQILDPATGTGTFLAEVVKHIHKKFEGQQGIWSNYVETHLLPRLNGFELLMASYAMAHLKLDLLLTETGYKPTEFPSPGGVSAGRGGRLRVYLTNSLEEYHADTGTLFANWLSTEANEANHIKRDTPVMVVIGNPPYSVSSSNKSEWIEKLTADYKKDLNERNIQPLSDDYIKFIRFGQHFIEKNGSGVLAYISNNSFIDGIIHRQMRKYLLESFDKIYILDLHGNAKKKEVCPDGSADQNVFDIMQGVSINIFVKTGKKRKKELGQVHHFDLHGKRDSKYEFLNENSLKSIFWNNLGKIEPDFFFAKKDFITNNEYASFMKIADLFVNYSAGIQSKRDGLFIDDNINQIERRISKLINETLDSSFINEFNVTDSSSYKLTKKIEQVKYDSKFIRRCHYRPFDDKYIYYDPALIGRSFFPVMKNLLQSENLGLVVSKQFIDNFKYVLVSNKICDMNLISSAGSFGAGFSFPLYLYPETKVQQTIGQTTTPAPPKEGNRTPNLNPEIVKQIADKLGLTFTNEPFGYAQGDTRTTFAPIDILDYIYAVLHSPTYREKYKEFLKIDFPRVPYPKAPSPVERAGGEAFWQLVKLGSEIRQIHLLESPIVEKFVTQYPIDGNNEVTKPRFLHSPPSEGCLQDGVVENEGCPHDGVVENEGCLQDGVVENEGCLQDAMDENDLFPHDAINKNSRYPQDGVVINNITIKFSPMLELPYNPKLKQRARELRQARNLPEVLFWMQVTKCRFHKIDFDRQRVIGNYIVDFYVKKLGLVIEIDGSNHDEKEEYDKEREDYLISLGLKVYRIQVNDVMKRMSKVMAMLEDYIVERFGIEPHSTGDAISMEGNLPPRLSVTPPLEGNLPPRSSTTPPMEGNLGKVYINDTQYFDSVPEVAWNFYIGGYQPAQKWLKDRKGRKLEYDDILHYQKIIVALSETDRLMKEIDTIEIE